MMTGSQTPDAERMHQTASKKSEEGKGLPGLDVAVVGEDLHLLSLFSPSSSSSSQVTFRLAFNSVL